MIGGLAVFQIGPGKIQHVRRLDVGKAAEHLLQFGQVHELGEARSGPERLAVRGNLHRVDHFPEAGRPGVEMVYAALSQARPGRDSAGW